jgi:diguanylate cyclase (GGDEF)-like protein
MAEDRRTILIVEDDELLRESLLRSFEKAGWRPVGIRDGGEVAAVVRREKPDVVVLDVQLPGEDGFELCRRLRRMADSRHLPILMMTVRSQLPDRVEGLKVGADDYVAKPFDWVEMEARVEAAYRRTRSRLSANPLTGLPGSPEIEFEAGHRIAEHVPFVFAYVDIDHFKSFNDAYGYQKGDEAIRGVAALMSQAIVEKGHPGDFVGHIGGDDFVLILEPDRADDVLTMISQEFDRRAPNWYSEEDRARGGVKVKDRRGETRMHPVMSLSIGAVSTLTRSVTHYAKLVDIASEMKRYVKGLPDRPKSVFRFDKRRDDAPLPAPKKPSKKPD